jgi:hypothetical protein
MRREIKHDDNPNERSNDFYGPRVKKRETGEDSCD